MGFRRILAAIDFSPLSQQVFDHALDLAGRDSGGLMLFHGLMETVVGDPVPSTVELGLYPTLTNRSYHVQQTQVETQIQQVEALLRNYQEIATRQGVAAEFNFKVGDAGPLLCQVAREWRSDLIVLGRRGRRGITEVLLGSVSNYVLHHAPCAVLVIQSAGEVPFPTHL